MTFTETVWRGAWRPSDVRPIYEFAQANGMKLPGSQIASTFDIELSSWLKDIFDAIQSMTVRTVTVIAPIGSGKTMLLEITASWIVSEDPGSCQINMQDDKEADDLYETRLRVLFDSFEPVRRHFTANRHHQKKRLMIFDNMWMMVQGTKAESHLQSKRVRWQINDERWQWTAGRMKEASARTAVAWNRKTINLSQGSVADDETDKDFRVGDQRERMFKCAHCAHSCKFVWDNMKYDKIMDGDKIDIHASSSTARYVCPGCSYEYKDTIANRKLLSRLSFYEPQNRTASPEDVSFHYPAWCVWWFTWSTLTSEWIEANLEKKKGNIIPLRAFVQKRKAESWRDEDESPDVALLSFGYSKSEYLDGQLVENEFIRLMGVDVQGDHFWAAIRVFCTDGSSRLIFEGKILTIEEICDTRERFKVKPACVLMDSQYSPVPGEITRFCGKFKFTAMHGSGHSQFRHRSRNGDVFKPYSPLRRFHLPSGDVVNYVHWSNEKIKDEVVQYRAGRRSEWGYPDDVSDDWKRHMKSEIKRDVVDKKTGAVARRYVRIKRDNHLWDCECIIMAGAMMFRAIRDQEVFAGSSKADSEEAASKGEE